MRAYPANSCSFGVVLLFAAGAFVTGCEQFAGKSCTVVDNGDGTATIQCEDGTSATVSNGKDGTNGTNGIDGLDGAPGEDGVDGTNGTDGEDGADGTDGEDGADGLNWGETLGLFVDVSVSAPANGTHFVTGEVATATITAKDRRDRPVDADLLSALRLFLSGPRDPRSMRAATALLGASTDRNAEVHHYIDLLTTTNDNLVTTPGTWRYAFEPVSTELPGTYSLGVEAVSALDARDAVFETVDLQLGTATPEARTVTEGCRNCHQGASTGTYEFRHGEPWSGRFPGPRRVASDPVSTCWACHNNDGFAAVKLCTDGSVPHGTPSLCSDGSGDWGFASDALVRRAHGVHNGVNLSHPANTDPAWGLYRSYTSVVFPAGITNCATCHADDAWKRRPSRVACGSCHDAVDFAQGVNHAAMQDDVACNSCHTAGDGAPSTDIVATHASNEGAGLYSVGVQFSPPVTGTAYLPGDRPTVSLTLTLADGTTPVNWDTVTTSSWNRVYFFVYGPRHDPGPALTAMADVPSTNSDPYVDLRRPGATDTNPAITRTGNVLTYALNAVTTERPGTYAVLVRLRKASSGEKYSLARATFQVGTAAVEPRPASGCTSCHGESKMHDYLPFEPETCQACHDTRLNASPETRTGWSDFAFGYGRTPLARYVHQFHFGRSLTDRGVPHYDTFATVGYPQDVRHCTSCHAGDDAWNDRPSRVACTACHDTPATWTHVRLETLDPTPAQPYSGDEQEACAVCHAADAEFSAQRVHALPAR